MSKKRKYEFLGKYGSAEQLDTVLERGDWSAIMGAMNSNFVEPRHLDTLINVNAGNPDSMRERAIHSDKATAEHFETALKDPHYRVRAAVFRDSSLAVRHHPAITPDMVMRGMKDPDVHVRLAAMKHPLADRKYIDTVMAETDPDSTIRAVAHRKIMLG